ncbi:unspecific monooxygenase [Ranunculus cassubicifolius]
MVFPVPVELLQWSQIQHLSLFPDPYSISLLFSLLLLLLWINRVRARKSINLPPSPPRLPIIGHLHLLGALPHRSCQTLSKKYGPLVVQSAEMAKEIMKTHDIIFADRPSITASKHFLYDGKDLVFARYGEHWRQMRRLCTLDLLSVKECSLSDLFKKKR